MLLRERRWRYLLKLDQGRRKLPRIYSKYTHSRIWTEQLPTITQDLRRMPRMNSANVIKLIQRHAATSPYHPYTQGHLYLIYAMGLVFKDEASLFWGYKAMCSTLYRYGPDTQQHVRVVPDWVFACVRSSTLDRNMWDNLVRFRWIYIMFGQTFTTPETLCAAWDFVLLDTHRLHCMCAALLQFSLEQSAPHDEACELQRASELISVQISTKEAAAAVLAKANRMQQQQIIK